MQQPQQQPQGSSISGVMHRLIHESLQPAANPPGPAAAWPLSTDPTEALSTATGDALDLMRTPATSVTAIGEGLFHSIRDIIDD